MAPDSPWQNGFAERLIGSIRRECVDHIIVLGERHLRQVLKITFATTMNLERTCRWTKMRPSHVQFRSAAALPPFLFLVDYIINTAGFEFSTGTVAFSSRTWGAPASDSICLGSKRGRTNQTSVCRDIAASPIRTCDGAIVTKAA